MNVGPEGYSSPVPRVVSTNLVAQRATAKWPVSPLPRRDVRLSLATQRLLFVVWLVSTDIASLTAAFLLAYWVRFGLQFTVAPEVVPAPATYQLLTALLIPLWLSVFVVFDLYDSHRVAGAQETARTFHASTTATMLVIVGTFLAPQLVISRMWLVTVWLLSFCFVIFNRFIARRIVYSLRRRGYLVTPTLIIGTNDEAESLAEFLMDWQASGVHLLGFVSVGAPDGLSKIDLPVVGTIRDVACVVQQCGAEDLIVAITAVERDDLLKLVEQVEGLSVQVRISSGLYELLTTRVALQKLGTVPLLSLHRNRLDRGQRTMKTVLDRSIAIIALVMLSPLLCLIASCVRFDSPGSILYRRRVLGVGGKQFDAFKFRTMHVDGDERLKDRPEVAQQLRIQHKSKQDPRVTPVGRWLRKFSLDELPQLINVLRGQMSLVGPRMITAEEGLKYGAHRANLLTVKPGITGLWQVSGRSDLSYEERVKLDMYYVRNYSVWMDLQILFVETLPAVLKSRGAY